MMMSKQQKIPIGFIGLGHMGTPMVSNLLTAGYSVRVYDINSEAVDNVVKQGAQAMNSPAQCAKDARAIMTSLQTGDQVLSTCLGDKGIFSTCSQSAIYCDFSSIAINTTRELHQKAQSLGLAMIDAPVSGGVKGAQQATLTIMVGGDVKHVERAKPILAHLGQYIIHAGPAGHGQAAKICNNMMLAISMIAVSEGFLLGEKLGLDAKRLFDIASRSSSQCWSMTSYCPVPHILEQVPSSHDYKPGFSAKMMLKDLKLSQDAAQLVDVDTPLGNHATQLYQQFVNSDHGEIDFSAIITMLRQSSEHEKIDD